MRKFFAVFLLTACLGAPTNSFADDSPEQKYREELKTDSTNAHALYNLACVVALDNRPEEAMRLLLKSVRYGFSSFEHLLVNDPDLDILRKDPEFKNKIMAAVEQRREDLRAEIKAKPYRAAQLYYELAVLSAQLNEDERVPDLLRAAFNDGYDDFPTFWNQTAFNRFWKDSTFRDMANTAFDNVWGWKGDDSQKLFGLMTIWSEAKYNFAFFDQVPYLDWDEECRAYIPKVQAADNLLTYYRLLQELVAKLHDGHTNVFLPGSATSGWDHPPIELRVIGDKVYIYRVGDQSAVKKLGLKPGMEVITIDSLPARTHIADNIERYYYHGRPRSTDIIDASLFMHGPADQTEHLEWKDFEGNIHSAEIQRNNQLDDKTQFTFSIDNTEPFARFKLLDNNIMYCELNTFNSSKVVSQFAEVFDTLDLSIIKGFILDVRRNGGGNSSYGFNIASRFLSKPVESARWKSRKYIPAYRAWGREEGWHDGGSMSTLQPTDGPRFTGPLVVLISPATYSAAEDFLVPLDYSNRAILVGDTTAGSTGQPLFMPLPGGGSFRVCTKRDTYPDGREFVGLGIAPDIFVRATVEDMKTNRDPILDRAVDAILNGETGKYSTK